MTNLQGNYYTKTGLITPALESGIDIRNVATETAPGKECAALEGLESQFPSWCRRGRARRAAGPSPTGPSRQEDPSRGRSRGGCQRGVLGLRSNPSATRNGNPRMFLYGTLARCE